MELQPYHPVFLRVHSRELPPFFPIPGNLASVQDHRHLPHFMIEAFLGTHLYETSDHAHMKRTAGSIEEHPTGDLKKTPRDLNKTVSWAVLKALI